MYSPWGYPAMPYFGMPQQPPTNNEDPIQMIERWQEGLSKLKKHFKEDKKEDDSKPTKRLFNQAEMLGYILLLATPIAIVELYLINALRHSLFQ